MGEPADPVSYAVEKCLAYAAMFDSQASASIYLIEALKSSRTLTDSQIAEVARRVIDELGKRAHRARFPEDSEA